MLILYLKSILPTETNEFDKNNGVSLSIFDSFMFDKSAVMVT